MELSYDNDDSIDILDKPCYYLKSIDNLCNLNGFRCFCYQYNSTSEDINFLNH